MIVLIISLILIDKRFPGSVFCEMKSCHRCGLNFFDMNCNDVCGHCGYVKSEDPLKDFD